MVPSYAHGEIAQFHPYRVVLVRYTPINFYNAIHYYSN